MTDIDKIENRALWVTIISNFVFAISGWVTYDLSNSQAILLDGNFSFVLAIATGIAIFISKNKHHKTKTFPFGSYVFEAAFVLSKGLLILGLVTMAFFQNSIKIIDYLRGSRPEIVTLTPIYYYTVLILVLSIGLLLFFNRQMKNTDNKSSLLMVEVESIKLDSLLTLSTGAVFVLFSFIQMGSKLDFLLYIGDSLMVVIIAIAMVKTPLVIIKNAFIELGGGTLQNQNQRSEIEKIISEVVKGEFTFDTFITKVGSGHMVVIYVNPGESKMTIQDYKLVQQEIKERLHQNVSNLLVEIALKDNEIEAI